MCLVKITVQRYYAAVGLVASVVALFDAITPLKEIFTFYDYCSILVIDSPHLVHVDALPPVAGEVPLRAGGEGQVQHAVLPQRAWVVGDLPLVAAGGVLGKVMFVQKKGKKF